MHALYAVLANAIGGSTYPATTVVLRGLPERDALLIRVGLSTLFFLPFLWRGRGRLARLGPKGWLMLAAAGVLGYGVPIVLGTYGQKLSSATSASLLIGMEPVCIVLLSSVFLGERLTRAKAVAFALGLSGATLIAFQGPPRLDGVFTDRLAGDLILASHGAAWALYTVLGKPLFEVLEPLDFAAATTVFALGAIAAWALGLGLDPAAWAAAPASAWTALAYLAVTGTFLGTILWNLALKGLQASQQANFIFVQPGVGVLLGVGLLGDPFTAWTAAGGALVLGGVWSATREAA